MDYWTTPFSPVQWSVDDKLGLSVIVDGVAPLSAAHKLAIILDRPSRISLTWMLGALFLLLLFHAIRVCVRYAEMTLAAELPHVAVGQNHTKKGPLSFSPPLTPPVYFLSWDLFNILNKL